MDNASNATGRIFPLLVKKSKPSGQSDFVNCDIAHVDLKGKSTCVPH